MQSGYIFAHISMTTRARDFHICWSNSSIEVVDGNGDLNSNFFSVLYMVFLGDGHILCEIHAHER